MYDHGRSYMRRRGRKSAGQVIQVARRTPLEQPGRASLEQPGRARTAASVAVVVSLVGACAVDAEVLRLLLGELGHLAAEGQYVNQGDLLVEVLGQPVDLEVVL